MSKMITQTENKNTIYRNLPAKTLLNMAIERKEGILSKNGALSVKTGFRTGRSPQDRFIVLNDVTENDVAWGTINQPISTDCFKKLWKRAEDYLKTTTHFISTLAVGADKRYQIPVEVVTDLAWHQLFCYNLFIRTFISNILAKKWTLLNVSQLKTDPKSDGVNSDAALIIDFKTQRILLCGLLYAGEMKPITIDMLTN